MEGLLAILKAAHCRSTHHHFALDALRHLESESGRMLGRMLLRYHGHYLAGAKDPDTRFRDFQNHVVHVADSHWGGAPRAAERWYGRVQQYLREQSWSDAAHAVGVLSHYFTDPLQPLHTAQSPREAIVHRPLEWSIYRSYGAIRARWREDRFRVVFQLSEGPDWLASAVLRGAELAHRAYETLVSTYDLAAARRDPRCGLSEASVESLAELFAVAITGWARVLDRTAQEADGCLPRVSLLPSTVLASVKIPYALLLRRIETQQELRAVEALLDHYQLHGEGGPFLPDEVQLIRKVLAVRQKEQAYASRTEACLTGGPEPQGTDRPTELAVVLPSESGHGRAPAGDGPSAQRDASMVRPTETRRRLTLASAIVDAPSIGPKTAARLEAVGIVNIGQFLGANPEHLVDRLRVRWIGVPQIADWQAQTRLMMALPQLRVREAQLLVGCGCRTSELLATAEPDTLLSQLTRYARTPAGRRSLRGATPPTRDEIFGWVQSAAKSRVA